MKISIVIPNYNGAALIKGNLPRIVKSIRSANSHLVQEIIIVDDGSIDSSIEAINSAIKQFNNIVTISLIQNNKNYGFSTTVNNGVKHASGDLVMLLNTDVYFDENPLPFIIPHFQNDPKLFAVGMLDKSIENGNTIERGRGIGWWERGFLLHKRGEVHKTDTFWVSGGSGIYRKQIWEKLGGLHEIYNPFYWEDIDLSYRASKSGYTIRFEPKAQVIHQHDQGTVKSFYSAEKISEVAYRNQILFVWENITDFSMILSHIYWLPIHAVRHILRGDLAFLYGLFFAFLNIQTAVKDRLRNKKLFKKKDKDCINYHLTNR